MERNTDYFKLTIFEHNGMTIVKSEKDFTATQLRDIAAGRGVHDASVLHRNKAGYWLDVPKHIYDKERSTCDDSLIRTLYRDEEFIEKAGKIDGISHQTVGNTAWQSNVVSYMPTIQKRPPKRPFKRKFYPVID